MIAVLFYFHFLLIGKFFGGIFRDVQCTFSNGIESYSTNNILLYPVEGIKNIIFTESIILFFHFNVRYRYGTWYPVLYKIDLLLKLYNLKLDFFQFVGYPFFFKYVPASNYMYVDLKKNAK